MNLTKIWISSNFSGDREVFYNILRNTPGYPERSFGKTVGLKIIIGVLTLITMWII